MLLDGVKLRDEILEKLKSKIEEENIHASLSIISVGDDPASQIYIKNKIKACQKIGIEVKHWALNEKSSQEMVINLIDKLNCDDEVTGIILQSPVPNHIDFDACAERIDSLKDVDGFTKENIYNLYMNKKTLVPCTVKGIIRLLDAYKIPISGANVLIIGRGNIVGHPLSLALINENATVTLSHSKTKDLKSLCLGADIVISATGKPHLITEDMIKEGTIVIDVGVTREEDKIVGDIDFENVSKKASYITPNPGGVGPMTVAMIMENVIEAYERRK